MHSVGHYKDKYFPSGLIVQRSLVAKLLDEQFQSQCQFNLKSSIDKD